MLADALLRSKVQTQKRMMNRWRLRGSAACAVLMLVGCATPAGSIFERIEALGFVRTIVPGIPYRHLLARASAPGKHGAIHVYIDHDGLPWVRPDLVSTDPTPRFALALELMARDDGDRVYLGRPCYFGLKDDTGCSAQQWTDARYSETVVQSMAAVINQIVAVHGARRGVVLIGYSGGGTIAWLVARRVPATTAVLTIAGNLDVAAWTTLHRFSPLTGSLNPAWEPPLPADIRQVHWLGGRDAIVPPAISRAVAERQPHATIVEIAEFDHVCCWIDRWPALLQNALGQGQE